MTLIVGENGTGKSTLANALVWGLYGVTTHSPSAEGDDVVNEAIGKNCEVRVQFIIGEYQHYEVMRRRVWKKGGKAAQLMLTTWCPRTQGGGAGEMTRGLMRDTQDVITKIIGMSVTTFQSACIFGQGGAYRFSRLTDSEKKGVLDEMLGSEVYAKASEVASKRATQVELELIKTQTSLETSSEALADARDRLASLEGRAKDASRIAKEDREQIMLELAEIEAQWERLKDGPDLVRLREALATAKDGENNTSKRLRFAQTELAKSQAEIERLKTERSKIAKLEGAACLLCKQHVSEAHVHEQTETIDEAIGRSTDRVQQQTDIYTGLGELLAELRRVTESCRDAITDATARASKRERLEDQIKALTKKAKASDTSPHWADLIAEAKNSIDKLKAKRKTERIFARQRKNELSQLRFWQAGFGAKGLRSLLLDSVLPYLNAKLVNYTNALTGGNIEIEFRTQRRLKGGGLREDFHVHVENKHGATKYNLNSVGERAKIDLVVGLALQDMAASRSRVPVNVAFFDEVFDGLDGKGIDRAVQVLSELKRESAFVITHNDDLKTFFQNVITVVKKNGVSQIEEGEK